MSGSAERHHEHHAQEHTPHASVSHEGGKLQKIAKATGNLGDNVVSTPFRVGGIVANTALDISDTFNNIVLRSAEIRHTGNQEIREILSESGRGSFWQRILKVPIGLGLAAGKYVESRVRSVVTPLWHGLRDGFDTVGNPIINIARAVTYIPNTKPADTYKFDKLAARDYEKKGRNLMKLMPWKNNIVSGQATSTQQDHQPHSAAVSDHTVDDLQQHIAQQEQENHALQQQLAEAHAALEKHTAHTHTEEKKSDDKHPEKKEAHVEEKKEVENHDKKEEHNDAIDLMKKDADGVREKLTHTLPKDYEVSRDEMPKGMQKLSAIDKHKEKRSEGEVVVTVYEPGKVRIKYNPYDHYEEFYYFVETDIAGLDSYISAIGDVVSKKHDLKSLTDAGMKKVETKAHPHGKAADAHPEKKKSEEKHPDKEEKKDEHHSH